MTELAIQPFRTIGPSDTVPNDFVVPHYLDNLKRPIAIARVADRLYAFDDPGCCRSLRQLFRPRPVRPE